MALSTHRDLRVCAQWAFPGVLQIAANAWDGVEDIQTYINREWTAAPGKTLPTAIDIEAQETAWRTARKVSAWKNKMAETDDVTSRAMEDLVDALITKGVIVLTDLPAKLRGRITAKKTLRSARPV